MTDHYKILGVPRTASLADIKTAYKKLAIKFHPDKNEGNKFAEEFFKHFTESYKILSDPFKKGAYDFNLKHAEKKGDQKELKTATSQPVLFNYIFKLSQLTPEERFIYLLLKLLVKK